MADQLRKNPSRKSCEEVIRRILMTETLEHGSNRHFKSAADFMTYFESLYPAGSALTKQVQRAIRSLAMPRDKDGYFIINKTESQLRQEEDLAHLLKKTHASVRPDEIYETLFLSVQPAYKEFLLQLIEESVTLEDKYVTILNTSNGLLFYTRNRAQLEVLLNSMIDRDSDRDIF